MSNQPHLTVEHHHQVDVRPVLDIVLKTLDEKIHQLDYDRGWGATQNELAPTKRSKKLQKELDSLLLLDNELTELRKKIGAQRSKVEKAIPEGYEINGHGSKYKIVETYDTALERQEGNKKVRKAKVQVFKDLRERILLAAANGESLGPYVEEFNRLK